MAGAPSHKQGERPTIRFCRAKSTSAATHQLLAACVSFFTLKPLPPLRYPLCWVLTSPQTKTRSEGDELTLVEELKNCSGVKYVVEQRQYHDPLSAFVMQGDDSLHMHNTVGLLFELDQSRRNSSVCKDHESLAGAAAAGRNSAEIPVFDIGQSVGTGRRLLSTGYQVTHELNAEFLWDKSHTGSGVKVAVFDTGLGANHPHFRNVKVRLPPPIALRLGLWCFPTETAAPVSDTTHRRGPIGQTRVHLKTTWAMERSWQA